MKLSTRLGLIVGFATLGALVLVFIALQSIRSSMLADRQDQIRMTLTLVSKQVGVYVAQKKAGKLSREEAQAKAKEALSGLRNGDDYVFVRAMDATVLVHPDPRKEGKIDFGGKMPNGRTLMQIYVDALKTADLALVEVNTKRPNGDVESPIIRSEFFRSDDRG